MKLLLAALALAAFFSLPSNAQTAPANATVPPAPATRSCTIVHTTAGDGDNALASEHYDDAATFFAAQRKLNAADEEAHLGLVRAYIGQNKVAEAIKDTAAWVAASPHSALAEVASAETAYRAANLTSLRLHIVAALGNNSCEGRAQAIYGDLMGLSGKYATEARIRALAHKLRPDDELIRRDWIFSLPRAERLAELSAYLADKPHLSADDLIGYNVSEQHLRARRPHECHITSKAESTHIPLSPVFGDSSRVEAFGLDVLFDGKRRRMQIDTGASGILLSASAAKRLNLTPEFHLKTGGVGDDGDVESYLTHVQTIQIGDIQISDCLVEVLAKSGMLDVDGLIGMDVFSHSLITLDYPNKTLQLDPLPAHQGDTVPQLNASGDDANESGVPHDAVTPAGLESWLHFVRIGHDILLPSVLKESDIHYTIMDTGAGGTTLSTEFASTAGRLDKSDAQFRGLSGKVKQTYESKAATLSFGNLRLPPHSYFAFDMTSLSHHEHFELSGLIGLPTLSRLKIHLDYRDNLVRLEYDPNHDPGYFPSW